MSTVALCALWALVGFAVGWRRGAHSMARFIFRGVQVETFRAIDKDLGEGK